jgi:hypothetical protein
MEPNIQAGENSRKLGGPARYDCFAVVGRMGISVCANTLVAAYKADYP